MGEEMAQDANREPNQGPTLAPGLEAGSAPDLDGPEPEGLDLDAPWRRLGGTLGEVLDHQGLALGEAPFLILTEDDGSEIKLSYAAFLAEVRRRAEGLRRAGVAPGDRVALVLPTGLDFVALFFATLYVGATAVPCYPPARANALAEARSRLARSLDLAKPVLAFTHPRCRMVVEAAACEADAGTRVLTPDALGMPQAAPELRAAGHPDDVALVQFSSGSTGAQRGVLLTHRQLLANVASTLDRIRPVPGDVNCSWLPLYHDMGLIGGLMMPICCGIPLSLISPQSFLLDPKRWLRAMHRHGGTISTAPNFAYHLVAHRLADEELAGLDLSRWRIALCGAESVAATTLSAFATRLAPYGFDARALAPVYGLAEAALGVAFSALGQGPKADPVDAEALGREGVARPLPLGAEGVREVASVGLPLPGYAIRIVDPEDPEGVALPERRIGEIQVMGPSVMKGYLGDPEGTAHALRSGWLRTGDQGYLAAGELHVVGRLKELIVKGGRNYAPQELEGIAQRVKGVRAGRVAAFGVPDPASGTESVVVVAESREPVGRHAELAREISARIAEGLGLRPDHVAVAPPNTLPKTSSGKLQRGRCRERWLAGSLKPEVGDGLLEQSRIVGLALVQRLRRPSPRRHG